MPGERRNNPASRWTNLCSSCYILYTLPTDTSVWTRSIDIHPSFVDGFGRKLPYKVDRPIPLAPVLARAREQIDMKHKRLNRWIVFLGLARLRSVQGPSRLTRTSVCSSSACTILFPAGVCCSRRIPETIADDPHSVGRGKAFPLLY